MLLQISNFVSNSKRTQKVKRWRTEGSWRQLGWGEAFSLKNETEVLVFLWAQTLPKHCKSKKIRRAKVWLSIEWRLLYQSSKRSKFHSLTRRWLSFLSFLRRCSQKLSLSGRTTRRREIQYNVYPLVFWFCGILTEWPYWITPLLQINENQSDNGNEYRGHLWQPSLGAYLHVHQHPTNDQLKKIFIVSSKNILSFEKPKSVANLL